MSQNKNKSDREQSYKILDSFLNEHDTLDIVAWWQDYGTAVFWNTPFTKKIGQFRDEEFIEFKMLLEDAERVDIKDGKFPFEGFADLDFKTCFSKMSNCSSRKNIGPITCDTGGGYRFLIRFWIYGHSNDNNIINEINHTANDIISIK